MVHLEKKEKKEKEKDKGSPLTTVAQNENDLKDHWKLMLQCVPGAMLRKGIYGTVEY